MIPASQCHGRISFPTRPEAGTDPWARWWDEFRSVAVLHTGDLGPLWAITTWTDDGAVVTLHHRLLGLQKRLALTHEMHHLAVGGVCRERCPRNEAKVVRECVRWLLPDVERFAGLLRRHSMVEAGRRLGVDWATVWQRLQHTTHGERRVIDEVMRERPAWLPEQRSEHPSAVAS